MKIQFIIVGILLISLSAVHIIFPRYFKWTDELKPLSLINRQMIYVHTFFIALIVFLMGLLCVTSPQDLSHTVLGRKISFGLGVFWLCRLVIQFFGYSSALWKGKKFETAVHIIFSLMWIYLSFIFFTASLTVD